MMQVMQQDIMTMLHLHVTAVAVAVAAACDVHVVHGLHNIQVCGRGCIAGAQPGHACTYRKTLFIAKRFHHIHTPYTYTGIGCSIEPRGPGSHSSPRSTPDILSHPMHTLADDVPPSPQNQ